MMGQVISRLVESLRRPLAVAGASMLIATAVALVAAKQALDRCAGADAPALLRGSWPLV